MKAKIFPTNESIQMNIHVKLTLIVAETSKSSNRPGTANTRRIFSESFYLIFTEIKHKRVIKQTCGITPLKQLPFVSRMKTKYSFGPPTQQFVHTVNMKAQHCIAGCFTYVGLSV